jgi:hypothetical protein
MKANVGTIDRIVRVVGGGALVAASVAGVIGAWGWLGVIPLATAVFGYCPAYLPLGINTCSTPKAE